MDNKKKITIAVVATVAVIAIAIIVFLLTKNTKTLHTISFDTNGGVEVTSQEVENGDKATKPTDPTKEGHEFLGWYLDNKEFDFTTPIEEDVTLEAKWKVVIEDGETDVKDEDDKDDEEQENAEDEEVTKYTVKFDSNGGSSVSKQTVEENKKATKPSNPKREGYTFKGWYLGSKKFNFSTKITKNITLVAKWTKIEEEKPDTQPEEEKPDVKPEETKEYTVTFNTDGGSSVKAQTVKENGTATKPSNPTRDGYTFKGWYLDGAEYNFSNKVTKNITLTAKWEKNKVVSYKVEKVSGSIINQVRIFVTADEVKVAGTVDITYTNGTKVTVNVPATGLMEVEGTYTSISNPKVK